MNRFNLRAYGWVLDSSRGILLSEERGYGLKFTKFPGGGVELGESPLEALRREFFEETKLHVPAAALAHVTEACVPSSFDDSQVIAIYYLVSGFSDTELAQLEGIRTFGEEKEEHVDFQRLFWENDLISVQDRLTFEMDQKAWKAYLESRP